MKYISKKLPDSLVELEVVLDHQEFLNYYQPVYEAALSAVHLKGFRPGAAPKEMAEKAVDKEKVFHEAVSKAARDSLREITKENNWQLIDQPKVEVLETEPLANKGLKFKATIAVFPEIKLGDYKKIAKKVFGERKPVLVTDEEVKDNIKWVLNSRAKLTRVNREAKIGDLVEIDFSGKVDGPVRSSPPTGPSDRASAGEASNGIDGLSGNDQFILGEGKFVKGFEENLVGHKEGDQLEFSVEFPADYWKIELQSKKVDFQVDLKGVFERTVPELTDELAKSLGKFENAAALQTSIREGITKEKTDKENERLHLKIMDEIVKNAKIDLPAVMVERTLGNLVSEYRQYKSLNPDKKMGSEEEIRKNLEEKAKNSVTTNLVLYQIAKTENLEPTSEEVEEGANKILRNLPQKQGKDLDVHRLYDYSYGIVQNQKVFQFLENLK